MLGANIQDAQGIHSFQKPNESKANNLISTRGERKIFSQRRQRNGQQPCGEKSKIIIHKEVKIKITVRYFIRFARMAIIKY